MYPALLVLLSVFAGSLLTLLLQCLLLYRRKPEPRPRLGGFPGRAGVPGPLLRAYLQGPGEPETGKQQLDEDVQANHKEIVDASDVPVPRSTTSGGAPRSSKPETCHFLNAIFLFLFRELRDTALLRHWVAKKIKVELEELLMTRTAGRLLEGLSLREVCLGESLPVFTGVRLINPAVPPGGDDATAVAPEELAFEVQLEYNGGFHLAIDVDLVFGKSAYLFVKISRVLGRLRLAFTRLPFTHWSFCFLEDPLIDFEVKSQFEGRPMPQLTSIIVNQLKKVIKRKHTLPNYKIRYKPFFPFQVLPPSEDFEDRELYLKDVGLTESRLKVTLIECSRLLISGSYDQELNVHCTLELGSSPWKEKPRSSIRVVASSNNAGCTAIFGFRMNIWVQSPLLRSSLKNPSSHSSHCGYRASVLSTAARGSNRPPSPAPDSRALGVPIVQQQPLGVGLSVPFFNLFSQVERLASQHCPSGRPGPLKTDGKWKSVLIDRCQNTLDNLQHCDFS